MLLRVPYRNNKDTHLHLTLTLVHNTHTFITIRAEAVATQRALVRQRDDEVDAMKSELSLLRQRFNVDTADAAEARAAAAEASVADLRGDLKAKTDAIEFIETEVA
jgi:hypothetical protein